MQLLIVESPTKARKLSAYLGKEYEVLASVGHVRDLPKSEMGVDIEANFEPRYVVSTDKTKVLSDLKAQAAKADAIILATDPDREGEAIAWHVQEILQESLKKKKLSPSFQRASFYEITKPAVLAAIKNPVAVNMNLVDAQQARRVVDRLVGYEVSPVLWRKIRRGLSAGRVQSVALRLIVEREKEIAAFKPEEYWEVDVELAIAGQQQHITARVTEINGKKYEPKTEPDTTALVAAIPSGVYVVTELEKKARKTASFPPFSTSTLQQAAANRLGWSSKQTMRIAQQLYEEGLITYHRTDSFNLSTQALTMAREYIGKNFEPAYLPPQPRVFSSKSKNAQEAHEAIRVTDAFKTAAEIASGRMTEQHVKLYDLIWRRFLASQMSEAIYDQTSVTISLTPAQKTTALSDATLKTSGSILRFPGWRSLLPAGDDTPLPSMSEKQGLDYQSHTADQKFTQPPARYNDASLVKELEKRGIGRPSTYASIISVIVDRGYVERVTKRFFASPIGMTVADFLQQHFPVFMEYEFTAEMEEDLDRIARGEKEWRKVVGTFYEPFHKRVVEATDSADRVQVPVEKTGEACPDCGEKEHGEIVIRSGRFGKFKSCSRFPECKFTQNIVEKVEGVICPLCQKGEVIVKNSRWGKSFFGCGTYPTCDWASWKKPEVGETMTKEDWAIQQAARAERRAKFTKKKPAAKKKK
ncbi:MAG: type I DNA topoisomerase [bacterium]|nr:type I DNA topoisomerase [bacterium]